MPRLLDVSDEVRAEIGDDEADRLLGGAHAPDTYDCTSCRTPGDSQHERTSTVLFVGEETAVLAFAHARCIPSQVVPVSEEQLISAVRSISQVQGSGQPTQADWPSAAAPAAAPGYDPLTAPLADPLADPLTAPLAAPLGFDGQRAMVPAPAAPAAPTSPAPGEPAVLGVTCGLVLCGDTGHAALVVEPTGPVGRPGSTSGTDEFLPLLLGQGFGQVGDMDQVPERLTGWSVLVAMGRLHSILQPSAVGNSAWWQAHQPLVVTEAWRNAASRDASVVMYAAPAGTIGRQPREDLLRSALNRAAAQGLLVAATLPLAGT
ncbi:hypothetical protein C7C46_13495 [Streptomyces tateyamensis]|uniref:Uncharacterized protein n=1 Tax=Streptomyces tateyamensis TaxID=565073 RepID=A0A2V4NDX3_9ACTN|nr:hypothetical protein [Streptomyces tateyamensis]PYC79964.1 hypothetical protein C7C46_13495 [Streptomyces tateyamensis]